MTTCPETHYATSGDLQIAYQAFGNGPDVLVTRTVRDLTVGSGIEFEPRGTQTLRGVPGALELFAALRGRP